MAVASRWMGAAAVALALGWIACVGAPPEAGEICGNALDDDGDVLIDCDDPDCAFSADCTSPGTDPGSSSDALTDTPGPDSACGEDRQPCCEGDRCTSGLECSRGYCMAPTVPECGDEGEDCCDGRCSPGLACDRDVCVAEDEDCGLEGETCCADAGCDDGLVCRRLECVPCGGEDEACCEDDRCDRGLDCERGLCRDEDGGGDEVSCARHRDCSSCLDDSDCGWCSASSTCMEGDFLGPDGGDCDWFDWDFLDC